MLGLRPERSEEDNKLMIVKKSTIKGNQQDCRIIDYYTLVEAD
jgi:hypothetical protein